MSARVLLNESPADVATARHGRPESAIPLLGIVGLLFFVVGGADLALAWVPTAFGTPEWEFGTITQTLNGLPVPTLGLGMLALWGAVSGHRGWLRALAILSLVLAVVVVAMGLLYGLTIPVALKSGAGPLIMLGLKKAMAKSVLQVVAYTIAFAWLGVTALKGSSTSRRLERR